MNNGTLIFGHNSVDLDYVRMASFSASLVKKNLHVPVSLVTDSESLKNTSADLSVFDKIIIKEKSNLVNTRFINNKVVEFNNTNRDDAYSLTPYDRTLLIDADLFLFSKSLSNYWSYNSDFLICKGMKSLTDTELPLDSLVSRDSIPSVYATVIIFSKTEKVKQIFSLVNYIKNNWFYYSDLYGMTSTSFRNDFAFSIANHIINGFTDNIEYIPKILMTDNDTVVESLDLNRCVLSIDNKKIEITDVDIHIWDKFSILKSLKNE